MFSYTHLQRIPGLWSAVRTRQGRVSTGIYRSGMYFINVEYAVLYGVIPTISRHLPVRIL